MDIGVYPLFLAISMFGNPENINAGGLILEKGKGIDAQGNINMYYKDMDVTVLFSKISDSFVPSEIMGEKGSLIIEHPSEMDKLYFIDRKNKNEKIDLTVQAKENRMYYELKHFIELFNEGKKESPVNNFALMQTVMKIMDEARKKIGIIFPADKIK